MRHHHARWLLVVLFFVTGAYALAENITLTTYYPSPRGVYQQLRATTEVDINAAPSIPRNPAAPVPALLVGGATYFSLVGGNCPADTVWEDLDGSGARNGSECRQALLQADTNGNITLSGSGSVPTPRTIAMGANATASSAGNPLTIQTGSPTASPSPSNSAGGTLNLSSGVSTGNQGGDIQFLTATPGASGSVQRTPDAKMVIKGNGNVGIGTAGPGQKLTVSPNSAMTFTLGGFPNPVVGVGAYGANPSDGIGLFVHDTTTGYVGWVGAIRSGNESCGGWGCKTLRLQVPDGGGSVVDALSISGGSGNVGIGTTAPADPLSVAGDAAIGGPPGPTLSPVTPRTLRVVGSIEVLRGGTSGPVIALDINNIRSDSNAATIFLNSGDGSFHIDPLGRSDLSNADDLILMSNGSPGTVNMGLGAVPTTTPSPTNNQDTGNLDVNDVYLRAANGGLGQWASQPRYRVVQRVSSGAEPFCVAGCASGEVVTGGACNMYQSGKGATHSSALEAGGLTHFQGPDGVNRQYGPYATDVYFCVADQPIDRTFAVICRSICTAGTH